MAANLPTESSYWMSSLKAKIKARIPTTALNRLLLQFPRLYETGLVDFETNLRSRGGIDDLLGQLLLALSVNGDIIDCGSSRCGSSVIMAKRMQSLRDVRIIYALDSFEGFDRAELAHEREKGLTSATDSAFTSTSFEYVKQKLARLRLSDVVIPVKGYFQQTLPETNGPFALVFIDCDLRDNLTFCAETLWERLTPGGRIVFDDYDADEWQGARVGVDEFVKDHKDEIASYGLLSRLYYVEKASR